MECITHHHACDCREEKMIDICRFIVQEHYDVNKFIAGFNPNVKQCECKFCKLAYSLYGGELDIK
jgi:hypothetical protein